MWSRNVNQDGSQFSIIGNVSESGTCNDQYFLFPGVWNYAFTVSSFNGNEESDKGEAVVAPSPASTVTEGNPGPTCPPSPSWCPGGGQVSVPPGFSNPTTPIITATSSSTTGAVVPTSTVYPVVTNGQCTGPDCVNGQCTGLLCASFGCTGSGCSNGLCVGANCIPVGCIGPNCKNGVCIGLGCLNIGCVGSQCNGQGHCTGFSCIGLDCLGPGCGSNGICDDPNCSEVTCSGPDCLNGRCTGPSCTDYGIESGGGSDAVSLPAMIPTRSEEYC